MIKQTEALKLALEALNSFPTKHLTPFISSARTAIRKALASGASEESSGTEQPAQQGYWEEQPDGSMIPVDPSEMQPAQPPYGWVRMNAGFNSGVFHRGTACPPGWVGGAIAVYAEQPAQPQQEPVAWMDGYRNIYSLEEKAARCPEATIALVPMANHEKTSGSPIKELNCICGAVWEGDELVHLPRPPAQRKPLTHKQRMAIADKFGMSMTSTFDALVSEIEAAHGITESTK
mgnify:CR=1 FL=1